MSLLLGGIALRLRPVPPVFAAPPMRAAGAGLAAFGRVYPHFLEGGHVRYLYAAPLGLVPCPTLALVVGLTPMLRGLESRGWTLTLAVASLFYGLFGWFRLGVAMDGALLLGALLLSVRARPDPTDARSAG